MKRLLPLFVFALFLMGQDGCDNPQPDPGVNQYCYGNDYELFNTALAGWANDGAEGVYNSILDGVASDDRRSTVDVRFGSARCSGVALGPNVVLTAAHCGYGADTEHTIYIPTPIPDSDFVDLGPAHRVRAHIPHPDYMRWIANPARFDLRAADLMVLIMEDLVVGPYASFKFYDSASANVCKGLVAQGLGRWDRECLPGETPNSADRCIGSGLSLREAKYIIDTELPLSIRSKNEPFGKICYGDSGGPLYADVAGRLMVAGITSTTMSSDCLTGGTHVKVVAFESWVGETVAANVPDPLEASE